MTPCTASWNGVSIFVELSQQDMYDTAKKVFVFVDHGGRMEMHETTVGSLDDVTPQFGSDTL